MTLTNTALSLTTEPDDPQTTVAFLHLLDGGAPALGWRSLWTKDRGTFWYQAADYPGIAQKAVELAATTDAYLGIGMRRENLGPRKRGKGEDVVALPALWAEVDIAGPGHAKDVPVLPPNLDAVLDFIPTLPLLPTMSVFSGGGVHLYWCFQQPWVLETEEERMKAAALLKGWEKRVQHRAALLGWKLDSVGDLARVLRPTGTWNRKPSRPAPVKVTALKCDGPRYAPGDFEPHLLAISASHKKATSSHGILGGTPSPVLLGMGEEHTANTETRSATPVGQIDQRRLLQDALNKVDTGDGRNNTGFWLACQLRDNGHSQAEAEATVLAYAERMPPTNTKGELEPYTVADALASVRSAYQQPAREPWRVARAAAVVADAITKARETSDPSVAFDAADALANLPVAEYARGKDALRQALGRRLNLNDLERAVKEARRKHQAET